MLRCAFLFVCGVLVIAGCSGKAEEKAAERMIEKGTGGKANVDVNNEKVEIKTEDGEMVAGKGTKIPDDFPDDVFVYQPAEVVASVNAEGGKSLSLKTADDAEKVAATYKTEMKKNGWTEKGSMNMGGQNMLVYEKNGANANVVIVSNEEETHIQLAIGSE